MFIGGCLSAMAMNTAKRNNQILSRKLPFLSQKNS
jgi:hypothetical protein